MLVTNDTRVTAMRLHVRKVSGGLAELLLLRETDPGTYISLAKPGKRLQPGTFLESDNGLSIEVLENRPEGNKVIRFLNPDFRELLAQCGKVPLPPYIHQFLSNPERYQTVYAREGGSAAAPTAGLHFTPEIFETLGSIGVEHCSVTLDVSIDTFRPVQVDSLEDHVMHGETCRISAETADHVNARKGRLIAVGTTSVRTLESFASPDGLLSSGEMNSRLFIRPGYRFRIVQGMFTNFHMPKTTMMVMLSALCGRERILSAYDHAVKSHYRFLSFGDSMLIL